MDGLDEGSEEAALIQRKISEHRQEAKLDGKQFPDLGDLKDTVEDAVGNVKDAADDLEVGALTKFADALDEELSDMKDQVESFSKKVNSSAEDLKEGIATILAQAFNVTIESIPTAKKYEKAAMEMLSDTDTIWTAVSKTIQAGSKAIDAGLAVVGSSAEDLRKKVNATMQGALSSGKGVLAAIDTLTKTMKEAKSKAEEAMNDKDKDDSLLQTKVDPSEILTALNSAAGEASEQASAFAESFSDTFGTLSKQITETVEDKISADNLSKVHKSFEKLKDTATELAKEVALAVEKIIVSVTDATAAAGDAAGIRSGAAGKPLARWGLGVAAAAVFAAISI